MSSRECFKHCPRIFDCAEQAASLGRSGVVVSESEATAPVKDVIAACAEAAVSGCNGPEIRELPQPRRSLLGRLGVTNAPASSKYICGRINQGPQEDRYLFKDS